MVSAPIPPTEPERIEVIALETTPVTPETGPKSTGTRAARNTAIAPPAPTRRGSRPRRRTLTLGQMVYTLLQRTEDASASGVPQLQQEMQALKSQVQHLQDTVEQQGSRALPSRSLSPRDWPEPSANFFPCLRVLNRLEDFVLDRPNLLDAAKAEEVQKLFASHCLIHLPVDRRASWQAHIQAISQPFPDKVTPQERAQRYQQIQILKQDLLLEVASVPPVARPDSPTAPSESS